MMIIPQRALDWVERWASIGGSIGSDGEGRLSLSHPDAVKGDAASLLVDIRSDGVMRHGVGLWFLAALQNAPEAFE